MKKNIFTFGLILGTILCIHLIYVVDLCYTNPDFEGNDLVGYAGMIIVFSLIFFGVRNYRNKQLNGYISFGKAFKTGALIALTGSTMYVVFWLIYYYLAVPDFLDIYVSKVLKQAVDSGISTSELRTMTADMAEFKELYKNPLFIVITTYIEVLPIGLIVALISALILKRKKVQPLHME